MRSTPSAWILLAAACLVACAGPTGPGLTGEPVGLPPVPTARPTVPALPDPTATLRPRARWRTLLEPGSLPEVISPALTTPEPAAEVTSGVPIAGLAGMVGREVTVEGRVVATASFSAGFKYTLEDGTGQVVLLVWHEVYDACGDAARLNLGADVRARGVVGEYEGELRVQPRWGGAVEVRRGAGPWAEPRPVASLSPSDEGQRVMIEGQVVRTEELPSALKVLISDGSGEVLVFVWRNILERIPQNEALQMPGSRVRVVGTVTVYRGSLEVVPALPPDVSVLGMP